MRDLVVEVDAQRLRGALLNLIDNAIKATAVGGVIVIGVERGADCTVMISVADDGPGLAPEDHATVLERFVRPTSEVRPGTGLGLAIAQAVAAAHGGGVEIATSALGGLTATITLPASCVVDVDRLSVEAP
jgi:signal transduction histidine kinase